MSHSPDARELGAFLKACRGRLTPSELGLPEPHGHRKVAGLRREEVASVAAISVDYYTRLEQGRVAASASVLSTLVRALRLDEDQQAYVYELAGKVDALPRRRRGAERVRPPVRRLLEQLGATPAIVLGKRLQVLDWNPAAAALFTDFAGLRPAERNYVRLLFTDPGFRTMHLEGSTTRATPWRPCGWRRPRMPMTRTWRCSSESSPCATRTSVPGGPSTG